MKILFDITHRQQIESGEYKVEIGRDNPRLARIVCWDFDGNNLIVAVRNPNGREEGLIYSIDGKHKAVCPKIDSDLFIITPEPEMSEFEKALSKCLCDAVVRPEEDYDKWAKEYAPKLLELAREEIIKGLRDTQDRTGKAYSDGYMLGLEIGEAKALKDLPRWKNASAGTKLPSESIISREGDDPRLGSVAVYDCKYTTVNDLKRLPKGE